jgi:hypothetical protein
VRPNSTLEQNTEQSTHPVALGLDTLPQQPACRQKDTKSSALIVALSAIVLAGCAAKQIPEETTPGADALFREFLTCRTEVFQYVAANKAAYQRFGALKTLRAGRMWFDAKAPDAHSSARAYRFEKPVKISGLTAVAAGYDFVKGDGKGYSGGDATYWGFYFAESPEDVFMALRDKYSAVARMRAISGTYENMRALQPDGDKRYDQGSVIEADSTQSGAKSFFNCSIQYVIPAQG